MSLGLQVAGCALAAIVVLSVFGVRPTRASAGRALGAIVPAVLLLLALNVFWPLTITEIKTRSALSKIPRGQRNLVAPAAVKVDSAFAEWVSQQIPAGRSFTVVGGDSAAYQWLSYRLMPRWLAPRPAAAEWIVFYGVSLRQAGYRRSQLADVRRYQPKFTVARQMHPGP